MALNMKTVLQIIVTTLLLTSSGFASALPHNYDLPHNCVDVSTLTADQQSKKTAVESRALDKATLIL